MSSSKAQDAALIVLRTIIGWHFLYEGYYKLIVPGWSRSGVPVGAWSAAGYLKVSSGPLAGIFHTLAQSPTAAGFIDVAVPVGLALTGLSLMVGLFTQMGAWSALGFLTLFYLAAIPTTGVPVAGAEGTYLLVNKTLVEWAAGLVLVTFRTGELAGLDVLLASRRGRRPRPTTTPIPLS
jgi:thiosulfate dehydrogenase [quinone] large subunit